jgi:hypothetical protein
MDNRKAKVEIDRLMKEIWEIAGATSISVLHIRCRVIRIFISLVQNPLPRPVRFAAAFGGPTLLLPSLGRGDPSI